MFVVRLNFGDDNRQKVVWCSPETTFHVAAKLGTIGTKGITAVRAALSRQNT